MKRWLLVLALCLISCDDDHFTSRTLEECAHQCAVFGYNRARRDSVGVCFCTRAVEPRP